MVLTNDDGEARIRLSDATAGRYVLVVNATDHMPLRLEKFASEQVVSGTSFASPLVCGILATVLAADPDYRALPRDARCAAHARRQLERLCEPLGFPDGWEGRGLPRLRANP